MSSIDEELELLAIDLYNEGYQCGIDNPKWFNAWAQTMNRVAHGEPYHDGLVVDVYNDIKAH